jgi:hypothetical protein
MKHQSGIRRSFGLRDWFRSFLVRMQLGTIDPGTPFWERMAKPA